MTDCAKRGNGGRLDEKTAVTSRRIKSNSRTSVFIDYLCRTRRKTSTRSMRMTVCHGFTPHTIYGEITSRSGTTGVITRDRYTHYTRCHPTSTCDIDISVARRRNITRGRIRKTIWGFRHIPCRKNTWYLNCDHMSYVIVSHSA